MFVRSVEANLPKVKMAREAIEADVDRRSNLGTLQRALHTMKSDARAANLVPLADALEALEVDAEAAREVRGFEADGKLLEEVLAELDDVVKALQEDERPRFSGALVKRTKELGVRARERLRDVRFRRA